MLDQSFVNVSLSEATMRPEDLIPAFTNFLAHVSYHRNKVLITKANDIQDYDTDDTDYILEELFDALNAIAPEGTYFGAHPGDGSDYGFWSYDTDEEEEN